MTQLNKMFNMRVLREYKGPAARLVELQNDKSQHFVGIVFYDKYHNHTALTSSLDGLIELLKYPVATGITPLHLHSGEEGAFIYETGKCKSIAELIRHVSDLGLKPGPRAGLELMVQVAGILKGAVKIAEEYAICSHGGLTPWRLMIRNDGKIQVIGFAVPQVEILDFRDDPKEIPREDSFRYAPPERMMQHEEEDISSDLFALALIGFELISTRPMYDGQVSVIQESAQRADVSLRLNQAMRDGTLDKETHDFLNKALRSDREDRFFSPEQFISEGKRLLANPQLIGMSLFEVMGQTQNYVQKQSSSVSSIDEATGIINMSEAQEELNRDLIANITSEVKPKGKPELIPDVLSSPMSDASPKELLKMLQESRSNISIPKEEVALGSEKDSVEEVIVSRRSKANANLLSQLQESISTPHISEKKLNTDQPPEQKESPVKTKNRLKNEQLLQSLLTPAKRNSKPQPPPEESSPPQSLKETTESPIPNEEEDTDTAIMMRPLKVNQAPEVKQSSVNKKRKVIQKIVKKAPSVLEQKPVKEKVQSSLMIGPMETIFGSPQPIRSSLPPGKNSQYHISLGEGAGVIKQNANPEITVSSLIDLLLLHRVLPMRMDLTGRMTSHYRFMLDGSPCSGRLKMTSFSPKKVIMLCSVPNEVRLMNIEVQTEDDIHQFLAPVGLATSMGSIVDHLVSWLRLGRGNWVVQLDSEEMYSHDILFDVQDSLESSTLRLFKKGHR
jgi:hypothetical protein